MISNQVPACRLPDENGGLLFEIKTDGSVMWMKPHKMDEAIDIFFNSFSVPKEIQTEFRKGMQTSKVPMELMEQVFWRAAE